MRVLAVAAILALVGPAMAQERSATSETVEELASSAEVSAVAESIARIGCTAETIEKESATLFEIDDAQCAIGQYDIKLDEDYEITVMTRDE